MYMHIVIIIFQLKREPLPYEYLAQVSCQKSYFRGSKK